MISSAGAAMPRKSRNTVLRGDEWLANTTMEKIAWRRWHAAAEDIAMNLQKHHFVVGIIAVLVAIALASNYYLW
jgi:hypothetical protein